MKKILITGAGTLGAGIAAALAKRSNIEVFNPEDKKLAPGCSNKVPVIDFSCCNPVVRVGEITRMYMAKRPYVVQQQKSKKPRKQKPRRLKIKGKQYSRPFYIYDYGI